jgi:SOS-response transcriptional repressor LexA
VKRYRIKDGAIVLQAGNPAFSDMQVADRQTLEVWGGAITRSIRML